jgi:hypothetical protein
MRRMVLIPPVPKPWTTSTAPTTTTTTTTARVCGRARRRGNRSGQGGHANCGSNGRPDSADTPKHRDRRSCDDLSQQAARCQNAISHSAHPSFLSSHLHFKQAICETLGWNPPRLMTQSDGVIPCALSHTFGLGKDPRDPYLGVSSSPGRRSSPMAQTQHTHGSPFCQGQDGLDAYDICCGLTTTAYA